MLTPSSIRTILVAGVVLLLAVSGTLVVFFLPDFLGSNNVCQGPGCTSSISQGSSISAEAGNMTVVATYHPPVPDTTTTTSFSTSTSGTLPPTGSYTYSRDSQIDILGVTAVVSGGQYVTFSVQFQNTGSGTINVVGGGGSSLSANIMSSNGAVTEVQGPRCLIATAQIPLGPGQVHVSTSPGCWSGFSYKLVGSGTLEVQLTLSWSSDSGGAQPGSMIISAEFSLG